jgi:hypothetical protein
MGVQIVANPYLEINNEKQATYGNSISYKKGLPDINVSALSSGGGGVVTAHGVDISTAISMIKFKLPANKATDDILSVWNSKVGSNNIKFYEGDFEKTMFNASMSECSDIDLNASEGGVEVTFKGDPL